MAPGHTTPRQRGAPECTQRLTPDSVCFYGCTITWGDTPGIKVVYGPDGRKAGTRKTMRGAVLLAQRTGRRAEG